MKNKSDETQIFNLVFYVSDRYNLYKEAISSFRFKINFLNHILLYGICADQIIDYLFFSLEKRTQFMIRDIDFLLDKPKLSESVFVMYHQLEPTKINFLIDEYSLR